jgi:hypothetical protein
MANCSNSASRSTVSIYMVPRRDRPLQTWKTFLRNHMEGITVLWAAMRVDPLPPKQSRTMPDRLEPAGQDLGTPLASGIGDSTAPIAAECQSFLDNVVAQFVRVRAWDDLQQ